MFTENFPEEVRQVQIINGFLIFQINCPEDHLFPHTYHLTSPDERIDTKIEFIVLFVGSCVFKTVLMDFVFDVC